MAAEVEWEPTPDPRGSPESPASDPSDVGELLAGGRRPPWWLERLLLRVQRVSLTLRYVIGVVAVLCAVIVYETGHPSAPTVSAAASNANGGSSTDPGMSTIEAKARQTAPLLDYVRSDSRRGACRLVPLRASPQRAIVAAAHRVLPAYKIRDVARTLDEFGAMCAIDMRASDAHRSVLVIEVVAPEHASKDSFTALSVASRSDGSTTLTTAEANTPAGWSITVGTLGPTDDQPPSEALLALAQDPKLLW